MSKQELVEAIDRANRRETARARRRDAVSPARRLGTGVAAGARLS